MAFIRIKAETLIQDPHPEVTYGIEIERSEHSL